MENNLDKIKNSLLKLYFGSSKSELVMNERIALTDWDKEEKKQKKILQFHKVTLYVMLGIFIMLLALFIIGLFKNERTETSLAATIAIFGGFISTSFGLIRASERYTAVKLLKDLLID